MSIDTQLVFKMQPINDTLLLKTNFFSPNTLSFAVLVVVALAPVLLDASKSLIVYVFLATIIFPFTTKYASLKSHKSDLALVF